MARYTRADIHEKVANIRRHYGVNIEVGFHSPAGKSLGQIMDLPTGNNLSSVLSISELVEWLDGFCKALEYIGFLPLINAAHTLANAESARDSWPGECVECVAIVNDTYGKVIETKLNG